MISRSIGQAGFLAGLLLIASALSGGCATTAEPAIEGATTEEAPSRVETSRAYPHLTVDGGDYETLGQLVRALGESDAGGGVVLLSGLEERPAPSLSLTRANYGAGLQRLVEPLDLQVIDEGRYQFVLPRGYDVLAELSVAAQLHPEIAKRRADLALGAGTDLFNALAVLTKVLGVTVLADNAIADVWCGELFLNDASAADLINAVLQSTRVVPNLLVVESTADYVFIRSVTNRVAKDTCLNREQLSPEATALLARRVSVRLPVGLEEDEFQYEVAPLASVLDGLSAQLGVPVKAEATLLKFPVNRVSFNDMTVDDTLNLVVRQWPEPGFGFRVEGETIIFARE